jgi:hypothetical protein
MHKLTYVLYSTRRLSFKPIASSHKIHSSLMIFTHTDTVRPFVVNLDLLVSKTFKINALGKFYVCGSRSIPE